VYTPIAHNSVLKLLDFAPSVTRAAAIAEMRRLRKEEKKLVAREKVCLS
jgi:hypothetical protein